MRYWARGRVEAAAWRRWWEPTVTATKITRTVFSVDMNFIDSDDFELPLGMPAWPAGAIEARINMGGVDASSAGTGQWAWVTKTQFDAWDPALVGGSPTDDTGTFYRDFSANAPSTITSTARDFFIGKKPLTSLCLPVASLPRMRIPYGHLVPSEDVQIVSGAPGPAGPPGVGGGDSSSGYIAPKDEYVADDLGKRVGKTALRRLSSS